MEALQAALCKADVPSSHATEQLEQLDADGDDGQVLFGRKAVRKALCRRLQQACATIAEQHVEPGQARAALAFIKAVLRLTPVEPSEALAKQMLYGCGYFPAVASVLNLINQQLEAENAALPRDLLNSAARAVVRAIDDACGYKFTPSPEGPTQAGLELPSQGKPNSLVYGRVHLGPTVLQPLLELVLLNPKHTTYALRREAVSALLELCTMCRRNQQLLLQTHHDLFDRLCGEFLPTCGDHATQVDIMEILYRCAKNDGADDIYSMFLDAETARQFEDLINKRGKINDLVDELRALLVMYNGKKRSKASVVCLLAKGISLQHVPGVTAADQEAFYVDMGIGHFTIAMLPLGPDGEGEDDGPPDHLDIDHDNIQRVTVDQVETDEAKVEAEEEDDLFIARVQLKSLPACLLGAQEPNDAGGDEERPLLVLLQFGLEAMQQFVRLIKKDMPSLLVAQKSRTCLELSQPQPEPPTEPKQRGTKMSVGMPPSSYAKLPLTKSPHTATATPPGTTTRPQLDLQRTTVTVPTAAGRTTPPNAGAAATHPAAGIPGNPAVSVTVFTAGHAASAPPGLQGHQQNQQQLQQLSGGGVVVAVTTGAAAVPAGGAAAAPLTPVTAAALLAAEADGVLMCQSEHAESPGPAKDLADDAEGGMPQHTGQQQQGEGLQARLQEAAAGAGQETAETGGQQHQQQGQSEDAPAAHAPSGHQGDNAQQAAQQQPDSDFDSPPPAAGKGGAAKRGRGGKGRGGTAAGTGKTRAAGKATKGAAKELQAQPAIRKPATRARAKKAPSPPLHESIEDADQATLPGGSRSPASAAKKVKAAAKAGAAGPSGAGTKGHRGEAAAAPAAHAKKGKAAAASPPSPQSDSPQPSEEHVPDWMVGQAADMAAKAAAAADPQQEELLAAPSDDDSQEQHGPADPAENNQQAAKGRGAAAAAKEAPRKRHQAAGQEPGGADGAGPSKMKQQQQTKAQQAAPQQRTPTTGGRHKSRLGHMALRSSPIAATPSAGGAVPSGQQQNAAAAGQAADKAAGVNGSGSLPELALNLGSDPNSPIMCGQRPPDSPQAEQQQQQAPAAAAKANKAGGGRGGKGQQQGSRARAGGKQEQSSKGADGQGNKGKRQDREERSGDQAAGQTAAAKARPAVGKKAAAAKQAADAAAQEQRQQEQPSKKKKAAEEGDAFAAPAGSEDEKQQQRVAGRSRAPRGSKVKAMEAMHNQMSDINDDSSGSEEEAQDDGDEDTYKVPLPKAASSKRAKTDRSPQVSALKMQLPPLLPSKPTSQPKAAKAGGAKAPRAPKGRQGSRHASMEDMTLPVLQPFQNSTPTFAMEEGPAQLAAGVGDAQQGGGLADAGFGSYEHEAGAGEADDGMFADDEGLDMQEEVAADDAQESEQEQAHVPHSSHMEVPQASRLTGKLELGAKFGRLQVPSGNLWRDEEPAAEAAVGRVPGKGAFQSTAVLGRLLPLNFGAIGGSVPMQPAEGPTGMVGDAGAGAPAAAAPSKARRALAPAAGGQTGQRQAGGRGAGRGKHAAAKQQQEQGSLSEAGASKGGGGAQHMRALAEILEKALADDDDEDGSDDDDEDIEMLRQALAQMLANRKAQVKKKQAAILQAVQARMAEQVQHIHSSITEDAARDAAAAQQRLGGLEAGLAKRMAAIEALQERFVSELAMQWDAYGQEYSQLEEARQEIQAAADKRRAGAKRKLSQLQQEAGQWVVEAERKIARTRSEAGKLPGLANMLRSMLV